MKLIRLNVRKEKCKDTCPIPLALITNIEKAIKKVSYNEKKEKAEIAYDENQISEGQIIKKLKAMGYVIVI